MKQLLYVAMASAAVVTVGCNHSSEQRAGQQLSGLFLVHLRGEPGSGYANDIKVTGPAWMPTLEQLSPMPDRMEMWVAALDDFKQEVVWSPRIHVTVSR